MKKFISLAGYSLVIASQIAASQALAKEVTLYTLNGLHTREDWPHQTVDRNLAFLEAKELNSADVACAKKQIAEIKKLAGGLDVDEVEINLEYGDKIKKGNYARVKKEKPYKIPLSEIRFGEKKVLEVGITMPYMPNGSRDLASCVIVGGSALKKAVDQPGANISESAMLIMQKGVVDLNERSVQLQSLNAWLECGIDLGANQKLNQTQKNCIKKVDNTNEAAVFTHNGDKATRTPASGSGSGSSSSSSGNALAQ